MSMELRITLMSKTNYPKILFISYILHMTKKYLKATQQEDINIYYIQEPLTSLSQPIIIGIKQLMNPTIKLRKVYAFPLPFWKIDFSVI